MPSVPRPESVAEPGRQHVVERPGAVRHVRVDRAAGQAVALDRDRPVALVLDQVPEGLVAQPRELLEQVGRLAEPQQSRPGRQRIQEGPQLAGRQPVRHGTG
jgi:hypothetical protein